MIYNRLYSLYVLFCAVRTFSDFQELDTPNGNSLTALDLSNCQDATMLLLTSSLPSPNTLKIYIYSLETLQFEQMESASKSAFYII